MSGMREWSKKKSPKGDFSFSRVKTNLDANDVVGSFPFLFFFQLKSDRISLRKNITEASALHIALVKKHFVAIFGNDKAKTLRHIEKLHCTVIHSISTSRIHKRVKKNPSEKISLGLFKTNEIRLSQRLRLGGPSVLVGHRIEPDRPRSKCGSLHHELL